MLLPQTEPIKFGAESGWEVRSALLERTEWNRRRMEKEGRIKNTQICWKAAAMSCLQFSIQHSQGEVHVKVGNCHGKVHRNHEGGRYAGVVVWEVGKGIIHATW